MVRNSPSNKTPKQTATKDGKDKTKPIRRARVNTKTNIEIAVAPNETHISRYERFVNEYVKDFNGTQAYIRAGLPGKSPEVRASTLLRNQKVQELLAIAKKERLDAIKIDANYVLKRLVEIDNMDALDILEDDGSVRPIKEWPKIWRQFISGFEISTMISGKDDNLVASILKKIKWPDKTKNLELIGKHIDVGAFRERIEHTGLNGGAIQTEMKITAVDPIEAAKQYQQAIQGL